MGLKVCQIALDTKNIAKQVTNRISTINLPKGHYAQTGTKPERITYKVNFLDSKVTDDFPDSKMTDDFPDSKASDDPMNRQG
jgi:hypothetical protein